MKTVLTVLALMGLSVFAAPVLAADNSATADGFGDYFTASEPDALSDNNNPFTAEELGNIEPAAGGEPVFILPGDSPDSTDAALMDDDGRLAAPAEALVPGMETTPAPVTAQP